MRSGASEFHLNLITHPNPKQASDFYTRLDMQWEQMCRAVQAIDPEAWVDDRERNEAQRRAEECPIETPLGSEAHPIATSATAPLT
jgi:hypothetical protein